MYINDSIVASDSVICNRIGGFDIDKNTKKINFGLGVDACLPKNRREFNVAGFVTITKRVP